MAAGLSSRGYDIEAYAPPLALGDATWHAGWTLHSAPGQPAGGPPRVALAASFFADGARRLSTKCACAALCGMPPRVRRAQRRDTCRARGAQHSHRIACCSFCMRRGAAKRDAHTLAHTRTLPFLLTTHRHRIPRARAQAPASHAARRGRKRLR